MVAFGAASYDACIFFHPFYPAAEDYADAPIEVPRHTEPGDVMIFFIGGSHAGRYHPSDPKPVDGWTEIFDIGPNDLNLKAFYKTYREGGRKRYRSVDGKNTFVSIVSLRGIDQDDPIVDADAEKDSMPGRDGAAMAPMIKAEKDGLVLAAYVYDDPHQAEVTTLGFDMILSTDTESGDGIAIAVAPTEERKVGPSFSSPGCLLLPLVVSFS